MWSNWQSLGGQITSKISAVSYGIKRLAVFARGKDNGLWLKRYEGTWSEWINLGGALSGDPVAASHSDGCLDVFARGTDEAVWHRSFNGSEWTDWQSLGGKFNSGITATTWPGRIDLYVRGTDDAVWHKYLQDQKWSSWESMGGKLTGEVAATSNTEARIDVYVRGTDNALWYKSATFFSRKDWHSLGGQLASDPSVAHWSYRGDEKSWLADRQDIFAKGTDGSVWHYHEATGWSSLNQQTNDDMLAICSGARQLSLLVRAPDNSIWHRALRLSIAPPEDSTLRLLWKPSGNWESWESLGGEVTGAPVAASWESGRMDLFVPGTDGAVWYKFWEYDSWW